MSGTPQGRNVDIINFDDLVTCTDHRKGRKNKATMSCLRCYTEKRKCDRKRPCQRCSQLGMTGLCIYEVDDPDARHDPNVSETTRLRNRIAELENLVKELRGKPRPRWANALSERNRSKLWHSRRSSQNESSQKTHFSYDSAPLSFPMQSEPIFSVEQLEYQHKWSPSLSPMVGDFDHLMRSYTNFDSQASDSHTSQSYKSPCTEMNSIPPPYCPSCMCLANPSTRASLEFLASQIQGTLHPLEKLPEHTQDSQCPIYQIIKLNSILCNGLQSARYDGHLNFMTSHGGALPGQGSPHALEEMQLWSSSHSKDGYIAYFPD